MKNCIKKGVLENTIFYSFNMPLTAKTKMLKQIHLISFWKGKICFLLRSSAAGFGNQFR